MEATTTKTKTAKKVGEYKPTWIDERKAAADFCIVQVSPYYIRWRDGRVEKVTERRMKKLKEDNPNWMTDF